MTVDGIVVIVIWWLAILTIWAVWHRFAWHDR